MLKETCILIATIVLGLCAGTYVYSVVHPMVVDLSTYCG